MTLATWVLIGVGGAALGRLALPATGLRGHYFTNLNRSGAPLVLAPDKDDPALGADPARNNNFDYGKMDPYGYAVPLGSHIRRMNPRDTAHNMPRRRIIRRGGTYGPHLREGVPDDGVERGIAAFVGCASLVRQFEFLQNVWVNDGNRSKT